MTDLVIGLAGGALGVLLAQGLLAVLLRGDPRPAPEDGRCQAQYVSGDVRCELPAGHAGDHRGESAHLSVQWPA
jgi:hypothetical protein